MGWSLVILLGLVSAIGLILISNFVFYRILGEVNRSTPADQQTILSRLGLDFFGVLRSHRKLFPQSAKRRQMWSFQIAGFALLLLTIFMGSEFLRTPGR